MSNYCCVVVYRVQSALEATMLSESTTVSALSRILPKSIYTATEALPFGLT
jgi:hypothetical protein